MATGNLFAEIDEFLEQERQAYAVPGLVVGILEEGRLAHTTALGHANLERHVAVTQETPFWIGSCTKAFTATAIGVLVDQGKLHWDTPMRECLPGFGMSDPLAAENATVRDLLCHRTGLPSHTFVQTSSSKRRSELLQRVRHLEMNAGLRERFHYNDLMYLILGLLIERVAGTSWEEFIESSILSPLSMDRTRFSTREAIWSKGVPIGHEYRNGQVVRWRRPWASNPEYAAHFAGPAGAIVSTVADMGKWASFHLNGGKVRGRQIVSEEALKETHTAMISTPGWWPVTDRLTDSAYAFGWWRLTYARRSVLAHEGGFQGFNAMMLLDPGESIAVIMLSNIARSQLRLEAPFGVYDRLLGLDPLSWPAREYGIVGEAPESAGNESGQPSTAPARLTGCFENPGYGKILMSHAARGGLEMRYGLGVFNLACDANGQFHVEPEPGKRFPVEFLFDEAGTAAAIRIPFEPAVSPILFGKEGRRIAAMNSINMTPG